MESAALVLQASAAQSTATAAAVLSFAEQHRRQLQRPRRRRQGRRRRPLPIAVLLAGPVVLGSAAPSGAGVARDLCIVILEPDYVDLAELNRDS